MSSLLWSSAFAGIKVGLSYHTPLQFAGVRFVISGVALALYFRQWGRYWREVVDNWKYVCIVSLFQTTVQYALFYEALSLLPGAIAAMVSGSSPLFVTIVAHFALRDDRLNMLKVGSIVLGITGVAIISFGRNQLTPGVSVSMLGILYLLLDNTCAGYANVLVAKHRDRMNPVVLSSASLLVGGLGLLALSFPIEGWGLKAVSVEYGVALLWLSFLSAAAFAIWYTILQRPGVKVSDIAMWKFLIPVGGAVLSWLLLPDESPDLLSVVGMCIIMASLLLHCYGGKKQSNN